MCQMSDGFTKFVCANWPAAEADREWKMFLDEDRKVLVFRSNGDTHEVALAEDIVVVRREKSGKTATVFVGFASEGWLKIRSVKAEERTVVLRGNTEVFSQPKKAGWLIVATIQVAQQSNSRRESARQPDQALVEAVAARFDRRKCLEGMRWNELQRLAVEEDVFVFGASRQQLVEALLALDSEPKASEPEVETPAKAEAEAAVETEAKAVVAEAVAKEEIETMATEERSYKISLDGQVLKVGFNPDKPAQNDELVRDASARLDEMIADGTLAGGRILLINGPASLPVAAVITHKVAHLFAAIAVFDPKMAGYVVSVSHTPDFKVGQVVSEAEAAPEPVRVENFSRHPFSADQETALRQMFGESTVLGEPRAPFFKDASDFASQVSGQVAALVVPWDMMLEAQAAGSLAEGTTLLAWRADEESRKRGNHASRALIQFVFADGGWVKKTELEIEPTVEVGFQSGVTYRYGGEPIEAAEESKDSEA